MATSTPRLGLLKPLYDGDDDVWGNYLNQNADTLDSIIATQTQLGSYLPLAGGTLSGILNLPFGTAAAPSLTFTGAPGSGLTASATTISLSIGGSPRFSMNTTGVVTLSGIVRSNDGNVISPVYSFITETNTGIFRNGAGNIGVGVGGVEVGSFNTTGLVMAPSKDITLAQPPSKDMHAANRLYVDTKAGQFLPLVGGTLTGNLLIGPAKWDPTLTIGGAGSNYSLLAFDGMMGSSRGFYINTLGKARWGFQVGNANEPGNNTGVDLAFYRFDDAGNFIDTPIAISRATGRSTVNGLDVYGTTSKFNAGISFGGATVANPYDLSRHISLYDSFGGFNITTDNTLNVISSGDLALYSGGVKAQLFNAGTSWFYVPVSLPGAPTLDAHATTKAYVDGKTAGGPFLPLAGGIVSGVLQVGAAGSYFLQIVSPTNAPTHLDFYNPAGQRLGYVGYAADTRLMLSTASPFTGWHVDGELYVDKYFQVGRGAAIFGDLTVYSSTGAPTAAANIQLGNNTNQKIFTDVNGILQIQNGSGQLGIGVNGDMGMSRFSDGAGSMFFGGSAQFYADASGNFGIYNPGGNFQLTIDGIARAKALALAADPTTPLQAATKQYVDNKAFLPIAGGTMQGAITLAADPSAVMHAVTKQYSDRNKVLGFIQMAATTVVANADQSDYASIYLWDNPTGPATLTLDVSGRRMWNIMNATAYPVSVKAPGNYWATTLPSGANADLVSDGANVNFANNSALTQNPGNSTTLIATTEFVTLVTTGKFLPLAGGTITLGGTVTLGKDPVNPLEAATRQYVLNTAANYLLKTGGTMTGQLKIAVDDVGGPIMAFLVTGSAYGVRFTTNAAAGLSIQGVDPTGAGSYQPLQLGGSVLNLIAPVIVQAGLAMTLGKDPANALEAATKQYVDTKTPFGGPYLPTAGGAMLGAVSLVGVSTAPTATTGTSTTQLATTAFVAAAVTAAGSISEAPSDSQYYSRRNAAWAVTPGGLADGPNDAFVYGRGAGAWARVLPLAGGSMTGVVALFGASTAPTAVAGTSTTQIATTAFVGTAVAGLPTTVVLVASIAALRALATGPASVFVQGYAAVGDGGGGFYIKGTAGPTDNGGTIIVSGNGTYFLQTYGKAVSVQQFGAKGDGTTDDTTACQNALNASLNVVFPALASGAAATYRVSTTTLTLRAGHTVRGSGTGSSTILQMTANLYTFTATAGAATLGNIIISDLTIRGGIASARGISFTLYSNVTVANVQFVGCENKAVHIDRGYFMLLDNCVSIPSTPGNFKAGGFEALSTDSASYCFYPTLRDCKVHTVEYEGGAAIGVIGPCVLFNRVIGGTLTNFVAERLNLPTANSVVGIQMTGDCQGCKVIGGITFGASYGVVMNADGVSAAGPGYAVIENHDVDFFGTAGISINGLSNKVAADMTITNCIITAPQGSAPCITAGYIFRLIITSNTLEQYGTRGGVGVQISNTNMALINNNMISNFTSGLAMVPSCVNTQIIGNIFQNNLNNLAPGSDMSGGGTGTNLIKNNIGAFPWTLPIVTPAVPANGVYIPNTTGMDVMVYCYGGNGCTIGVNNMNTGIMFSPNGTEPKGGSCFLPANGTIGIAYATAPTWSWIPV